MTFEEYVINLKRKIINKKNLLFVCIGNSKILWDSIGPIIGSNLKQTIGEKYVIGDLKNNICNKLDLVNYYPKLRKKFIIAIDTAITEEYLSGEIFITNNPIIMGNAFNKNRGIIGDISIKIGLSTININKYYIENMAKFVCNIIKVTI